MKRVLALGLVAALGIPAHAEPVTGRLKLACIGGGAANKVTSATVNAWNSNSDTGSAQALDTRSVGFQDQVNLWIEGA